MAGCERQTFREPLPGLAEPYQRRTVALATLVGAVVREPAGRAGSRRLATLGVRMSRHSAVRSLLRLPLPARPTPEVIGVDDFALRKRHRYATVIINAVTRERLDVLADRQADTLEAWLRAHPGVRVVCRDSSGAYAEAIRRALPDAVQVDDRWHMKRLAGLLLSEPGTLTDAQRERLDAAIAACGERTMLSRLVRDFAAVMALIRAGALRRAVAAAE